MSHRRAIAARYDAAFADVEPVRPLARRPAPYSAPVSGYDGRGGGEGERVIQAVRETVGGWVRHER